jgi:hypothetical protein
MVITAIVEVLAVEALANIGLVNVTISPAKVLALTAKVHKCGHC